MPLVTQFYGMREFAIEDPDGYVITFASVSDPKARTTESLCRSSACQRR